MTRYKINDQVKVLGRQLINHKLTPSIYEIGTVIDIRGSRILGDRITYIVQLPNTTRMCFAKGLRIVRKSEGIE